MIILSVYLSCFFFIPLFYILRRILPEVQPQTFAGLLGIVQLPPKDFGILARSSSEAITPNDIGIADVFLSCIAKALTLQVSSPFFVMFFKSFQIPPPRGRVSNINYILYPHRLLFKVVFFLTIEGQKKGPLRCSRRWASSAKNWAFFLSFRCQTKQLFRVEILLIWILGFIILVRAHFDDWWNEKIKYFSPQKQ